MNEDITMRNIFMICLFVRLEYKLIIALYKFKFICETINFNCNVGYIIPIYLKKQSYDFSGEIVSLKRNIVIYNLLVTFHTISSVTSLPISLLTDERTLAFYVLYMSLFRIRH